MSSEERVFETAPALAAAEGVAFLDLPCAGLQELRLRMEAWLCSHDLSGFMEDRSVVTQGSPVEQAGEIIGRYRLLQQIGEGGFGSVWMAEQLEPVTRRVALKIIKAGMDTKEVISRFEAERQALAMMDHPNIAKVFDAGATEKGRPYFVMELVKGIPITKFCDEQGFTIRQRLELFEDVCSAINHAHQKGIIHRDIKPSNVMVTLNGDKPVSKVIDFGIAKATEGRLTERTLCTRVEQFVGTPAYMSPEQTAMSGLDVDTRSDIYALGILLYQLLTGKPPFDAKSLILAGPAEMRRIICEVEPPRPSSRLGAIDGDERAALAKVRHVEPEKLGRLVEPDLDWIVMKAIEKDRTRRYETANGLGMDIRRYLSGEPVSATPPGAGYRFRRFARRNRAALRVAAVIAAVLITATVVSTWQATRATSAFALANRKSADEKIAREDAEAITTFLAEVFQSPDPTRDGRAITVAELLDRAAKQLDDDPGIQPERRASLRLVLGRTYHALGLYPKAILLQEKARDYFKGASRQNGSHILEVMAGLANSYDQGGRASEALKLNDELLPLSRSINGPEHPDTLKAMTNLAVSYDTAHRDAEALQLRQEVLDLSREALGRHHRDTLRAMSNLAISYVNAARWDDARTLRREFLNLNEELLPLRRKTHGPKHPETLKAITNLAVSYHDASRRDEAARLWEEALPLSGEILGPDHPDTLHTMTMLGNSCRRAGDPDRAIALLKEVCDRCGKKHGIEHRDTINAMGSLAMAYDAAGHSKKAVAMKEEVRELSQKVLGPDDRDTLLAMAGLASSYFDTDRHEEALSLREEVVKLSRKVSGPQHPDTLRAMNNVALSYFVAGRMDEALKLREDVLALCRKVCGPEHPLTTEAMSNLAISCFEAGRTEEALKLGEEVLPLHRKLSGMEHPDTPTLSAMTNLAIAYRKARRLDDAISLQEKALGLKQRLLRRDHPLTIFALKNMAECYAATGRTSEADALRKEADALKARARPPAPGPR